VHGHASQPAPDCAVAPAATTGTPAPGLTEAEAGRRLAERGPLPRAATSRSYQSIVRANVLTVFNLILAAFGTLTLVFGDWRDALFLGIVVANAGIGIVQEVRAKRALDRLAALVAPTATVVRDGKARVVAIDQVVVGDLARVSAGDQVVADGTVRSSDGLMLDESLLTGETQSVPAPLGAKVRSGSFAVEGAGTYEVEAVGPDSYAEQVAGEARRFRHPRSPLEQAFNQLLLALVALMVVFGALLGYALLQHQPGTREAVATATAAVVSMVPEGLILLASLTYAVGALRMTRRGALAQQLNAIESLASVDVICTDKTGTLTESELRVVETLPADGVEPEELERRLAAYAAASPDRNSSLGAIANAFPADELEASGRVPFSSRRRWSAVALGDKTLVLGAPELFDLRGLAAEAAERARLGRRVLALAETDEALAEAAERDGPPASARPLGIVVLSERLRPETRAMVQYFLEEGVELKVLSGDAPETVAAIARDAGVPLSGKAADGRHLPDDPDRLRELALESEVIGRISPESKRRVVEALRDAGRYVAMVGDGVNDVPAMKAARLAFAQGSGAQMARSVADVVLVRGDFASIPPMVSEGRQALRNLQRVAKLYVTKSAFAAFVILLVGTTSTAYPLLPRHFSVAAALTIGIPSFFLALAPSSGPWRIPSFAREVARFAVPAGALVGAGVLGSYLFALDTLDLSLSQARTVATTVLVGLGLYLILVLEASGRRRGEVVSGMVVVLAGLYALVLGLPGTRHFFDLAVPGVGVLATAAGGVAVAVLGLILSGFAPGSMRALGTAEPPAAKP
jgi:cation-transporting ATPase E